jgi:hypothetical protein
VKTFRRVIAALLAAGLLWLAYNHFFPNDEKIIRRTLTRLATTASVPANPTPLGNLRAANALQDFFVPEVEVEVDVPIEGRHTFTGREELIQAAIAARNNYRGLRVEFLDVNVAVAEGKQEATAELTARATQPGESELHVHEMKIYLRKKDTDWRIWRAETVRTLKL